MTPGVVVRETAISVVINMVLSALFFVAVFARGPVRLADIGPDLVPQSFMVALMGSLVPGLLTARRAPTGRRGPIVVRSFVVALIAAVVIGGGGWLLLRGSSAVIAYPAALAARVVLGGLLAALVTPFAVRHAGRPA